MVASFSILADFVAQIGGDAVEIVSLVPPDGDPHSFQPRPSDLGRLRTAAVVVENGLGLEGWLSRLVAASGFRGQRVVATQRITPRRLQEGGRSVPDPHVWQDPRLASQMVQIIAEALATAQPARADDIKRRSDAYIGALARLDASIEQQFAPIPSARRWIVTTHDAFGYYGARYGIDVRAVQGLDTEAEPSPAALARLAAQVRQARAKTVFLENMTDPRIAEALAREAGVSIGAKLYSDSLSPPGGPAATYLDLLRYNTAQFVASMTG